MPLIYEGNPKHKEPWQAGRKGSLCPQDVPREEAQKLLTGSVLDGKKRYGTLNGKGYCAHQHDVVKDRWHGYPVGWSEVPQPIISQFIKAGLITKRDVKDHWEIT